MQSVNVKIAVLGLLMFAAAAVHAHGTHMALDSTRCVLATFDSAPDQSAFTAEAVTRLSIAAGDVDIKHTRDVYMIVCFNGGNAGVNATDTLLAMGAVQRFSFFEITEVVRASNTNELPHGTMMSTTPAPTAEPATSTPTPSGTALCDSALAGLLTTDMVAECVATNADSVLCSTNADATVSDPTTRPAASAGASCLDVATFAANGGYRACLTAAQETTVAAILERCTAFNGGATAVATAAAALAAVVVAAL